VSRDFLPGSLPRRFGSFRHWYAGQWAAWRARRQANRPPCAGDDCPAREWDWVPFWPARERVYLESIPYCTACLPLALLHRFTAFDLAGSPAPRSAHRIPLGLLLLSRGWLTPGQLRSALGRQRRRGGRLGDTVRSLGYVNEDQITAGLAMQWACPVLAFRSVVSERHLRRVPLRLQELHRMVPVHYSEQAGVLILAFSRGVDYSVTQALAGMLGCRIEPCLASETEVRRNLSSLRSLERSSEITFERVCDAGEKSSITQSYIQRWGAQRVRVTACGTSVWARLERPGQTFDLVFEASAIGASAA
jgi:hypothetical protein